MSTKWSRSSALQGYRTQASVQGRRLPSIKSAQSRALPTRGQEDLLKTLRRNTSWRCSISRGTRFPCTSEDESFFEKLSPPPGRAAASSRRKISTSDIFDRVTREIQVYLDNRPDNLCPRGLLSITQEI